jgi:hypothetical protein
MRVGFSLGRCIRDIVTGVVDEDDVVVIVSGTRFTTQEQLSAIVAEYMWRDNYLVGLDETVCQGVASVLFREGKIHQPRNFGTHRSMIPEDCVWADLLPTGGYQDPMVQEAWQAYRGMLGLTGNKPDNKEYIESNWKI